MTTYQRLADVKARLHKIRPDRHGEKAQEWAELKTLARELGEELAAARAARGPSSNRRFQIAN